MSHELWSQVDAYITEQLVHQDEALDAALRDSEAAGLPSIQVSIPLGKLLHLLARTLGARSILEIGTLGGYSAIWMGRALAAGGKLITLELEPKHAEVARKNLARAGLSDRVQVRVGKAIETLPLLEKEGAGPFDLFFIDADKESNATYFDWALKLSRPGSVIVVDNVVRQGAVLDAASADTAVQGTRRLYERIAKEPRVDATAIQTVGTKRYDGFAIARVKE